MYWYASPQIYCVKSVSFYLCRNNKALWRQKWEKTSGHSHNWPGKKPYLAPLGKDICVVFTSFFPPSWIVTCLRTRTAPYVYLCSLHCALRKVRNHAYQVYKKSEEKIFTALGTLSVFISQKYITCKSLRFTCSFPIHNLQTLLGKKKKCYSSMSDRM